MTTQSSLGSVLRWVFLVSVAGLGLMHASAAYGNENGNGASAAASASATASLRGTWSGTFTSNSPSTLPFTITVVIGPNSRGRLVGDASLVFECIKSHHLQVTVNGSNVVLAGSDADGDNITFRGTLDSTGTMLTLNYVLNGSAGRRCEIDNGSGTMGKRQPTITAGQIPCGGGGTIGSGSNGGGRGNPNGTPAGTYTLTVVATSGSTTATTPLGLTVQ